MSILRFEIRSQIRTAAVWTAASALIISVFMLGVYPVFLESYSEIKNIIAGFPKEFAEVFGLEMDMLFSFEGFYGFGSFYVFVFGAAAAASLAVSVFAREKRAKCIDFIFTKPISRRNIFALKLLSVVAVLAASNIVYVAVSMLIYSFNGRSDGRFFLAACTLFFTQLMFLSAGVLAAVYMKRVRSVSGTAAAIAFGAFLLSALSSILEDVYPDYFYAPLKYFDPIKLFLNGSFGAKYVFCAIAIIASCLAASFFRYTKSDAKSA